MKITTLTSLIILLFVQSALAQALIGDNEIGIKRFGKEVIYYKYGGGKELLDGYYRIGDDFGKYTDAHFKNGKKTGESKDYDSKGRLISLTSYKEGKGEGPHIAYHQNGQVREKGAFSDGEYDGKWEYFHDNGKMWAYENYSKGKKEGKWWKKLKNSGNGTSSEVIENFKEGKYLGHAEEKNEDGSLKWEREYTNNGSYAERQYFPNGQVQSVRHLVDYKLDGEKLNYNSSGTLMEKEVFEKDRLVSKETFYGNGKKRVVENYKSGNRHGLFARYTEDGITIIEGNYKHDSRDGLWKMYDEKDGRLVRELTYLNGEKSGDSKEFNEANAVSAKGTYTKNKKDGLWQHYNLAGKLIREVEYDLGKIISEKEYK